MRADVVHRDAIVIAVKGCCRGNGQASSRGSIGVFFHERTRLNRSLKVEEARTSQRADLLAAIRALKIAVVVRTKYAGRPGPLGPWRKLRRVVVKTNSRYVIDGMTVWMAKWEGNGWRNAKGKDVVNEELFRRLEGLVRKLEKLMVGVQWWCVEREANWEAWALADGALRGVGEGEALRRGGGDGGVRGEGNGGVDVDVDELSRDMEGMMLAKSLAGKDLGGVAL